MKKIPLSRGRFAIVDDEDFEILNESKWYFHSGKYAARTIRVCGVHKMLYMHRVILNVPEGMQIDHIDCDGLNNQKSNLRICPEFQNHFNMRKFPSNKSGFRGVHRKPNGRWVAQISVRHKVFHLGTFEIKEDAATAYMAASVRFHREFGRYDLIPCSS